MKSCLQLSFLRMQNIKNKLFQSCHDGKGMRTCRRRQPPQDVNEGAGHRVNKNGPREEVQPALDGSLMGGVCRVGGDEVVPLGFRGIAGFN